MFFIATSIANASNFVFHVIMSRLLGPSTYGALGSILAIGTVVSLAVTALQACVTQHVAEGSSRPSLSGLDARVTMQRWTSVSVLLFAVVSACSPLLEGFLHLNSPVPVVLFSIFLAITVLTFIPQGILLGRLQFGKVALALMLGAILRVGSGLIFVSMGWGLNGAVGATLVGVLGPLLVLVWYVRSDLKLANPGQSRLQLKSALLAVTALGGLASFSGVDSFLVRHYLPRLTSGYYVAGATGARIALFLPSALAMIAFPRLARTGVQGVEARQVLVHAVFVVVTLAGAAAAIIALLPHLLVQVLFGARYYPAVPIIQILSFAAAATGVATVLIYALLAIRSYFVALPLAASALAVLLISFLHHGSIEVAILMLCLSVALLLGVGSGVLVAMRKPKGEDEAQQDEQPLPSVSY